VERLRFSIFGSVGKLLENRTIDPVHRLLGKATSKPGEGGMIGRMLKEGQIHELVEGDPVVDLVLQFRVGIDPVPLLQEKPFEQHQGRIGVGAFETAPHGIMRHQDLFDFRPINRLADLFQSFEAALMFHGFQRRYFGEGHVLLDLLVIHIPSGKKIDRGNMAQYSDMSSNIEYLL